MMPNVKDEGGRDAAPPQPEALATGGRAGDGSTKRTAMPVLKVHWSESWIIRAAGLASFILFLGFATSAIFTYESIDSIAKLAHDDEIEASLSARLTDLKKIQDLRQQLVVERLRVLVAPTLASSGPNVAVPEKTMQEWLATATADLGLAAAELRVTDVAGRVDDESRGLALKWIDRDSLKVLGRIVEFPKGEVYEAFKVAEDVKQRYQLVGVKLNENILPTLLRASIVVLVASFVLLASIFIVYAQRFKKRIGDVIEGFALWSERDANFRFDDLYRGELKLITVQFNAMAEEVEANRQRSLYLEKIASWQIIARKLAHEIKNPLTPIQMMVSQLKRKYRGEDKDFAKLLDNAQSIITEEVSGLRRMVDNFSNFARLPQPEPKPTDLASLCRHVVELEKNMFPQHTIELRTQAEKAVASADEDLLRQVLINLVKNAGEACSEQPATIDVGLEETANEWLITVRDDGPGIPKEHVERVFEAYFTTKHTGPNPGMGLGLAVCQKIVIDHGGKLQVRSKPGETVFTIRLPKKRKETSAH